MCASKESSASKQAFCFGRDRIGDTSIIHSKSNDFFQFVSSHMDEEGFSQSASLHSSGSLMRLSAKGNGETKCIIFVDSLEEARKRLDKYVSVIVGSYPFISGFGALINVHRLEEIRSLDFVSAVSAHTTVHTCLCDVRERLIPPTLPKCERLGEGITVAVIDTGISPHMDFFLPSVRLAHFKDFVGREVEAYDDNGHGTAVAGIIAGNGLLSGGKYAGIAPCANIISLKAIGSSGDGGAFAILEAMQWVFDNKEKYNIRVVCMSFGATPLPKNDPLSIGAELLWKAGLTVVASAGNSGPEPSTIRSPGINPSIITVGAIDYGAEVPLVADFSSRGPAFGFVKPDIVTDGVEIMCPSHKSFYKKMSGTSMSAPIVAGACAAILAKNPRLDCNAVKELLIKNAVPLKDIGKNKSILKNEVSNEKLEDNNSTNSDSNDTDKDSNANSLPIPDNDSGYGVLSIGTIEELWQDLDS